MTPKRLPPDDPREWLNRARSNLARANARVPEAYLEDLCFDAQQAAEKAIKAVFIGRGERFPFVHDLDKLLGILERNGVKVPKYVRQANKLSPYAVVMRYPGLVDPVTQRQYRRAVRIATAVLHWAERQVKQVSRPARKKP
jgi:HEPN domain-containing protein